jgi:hypothetical protein
LKHNREIEQATATNTYSRGGLLPLHGGDDGVDVREGGEASEGDSGSVSPSQYSLEKPLFMCFVFSRCLLSRTPRGVFT